MLKFLKNNHHFIMGCMWIGLAIPTFIWWKESVLWVALMSIYANTEASFGAHRAKKAEDKQDE